MFSIVFSNSVSNLDIEKLAVDDEKNVIKKIVVSVSYSNFGRQIFNRKSTVISMLSIKIFSL